MQSHLFQGLFQINGNSTKQQKLSAKTWFWSESVYQDLLFLLISFSITSSFTVIKFLFFHIPFCIVKIFAIYFNYLSATWIEGMLYERLLLIFDD